MTEFYTPAQDRDALGIAQSVDAHLPNVLILGDSISIGYTPVVRRHLAGIANVLRPDANCGDTRNGLLHLDAWLGQTPWRVIHFNWGLHDLCYRHPLATVYGNRDKVRGTQSVPLPQYRANLAALVARLIETGATLIWASSTMVPENEPGRVAGEEVSYNDAASSIMREHDIAVNDLYALSRSFASDFFVEPGDAHFTKHGYEQLGQQTARTITQALGDPKSRG